MNDHLGHKIINLYVAKLSNSLANAPHREVPVPRRQDVDERPCVPRLDLNHFASQYDSPRLNQRYPRDL